MLPLHPLSCLSVNLHSTVSFLCERSSLKINRKREHVSVVIVFFYSLEAKEAKEAKNPIVVFVSWKLYSVCNSVFFSTANFGAREMQCYCLCNAVILMLMPLIFSGITTNKKLQASGNQWRNRTRDRVGKRERKRTVSILAGGMSDKIVWSLSLSRARRFPSP